MHYKLEKERASSVLLSQRLFSFIFLSPLSHGRCFFLSKNRSFCTRLQQNFPSLSTPWKIMPPLTLRPTFIHAPTQHVMIHCASWAFGAEMCGDALIKSVSAQPQVKCLRPDFNLLSPSLSGCWIDCTTLRRLYCANKVNKYIIIITINNRQSDFFFFTDGAGTSQVCPKKKKDKMWKLSDCKCERVNQSL